MAHVEKLEQTFWIYEEEKPRGNEVLMRFPYQKDQSSFFENSAVIEQILKNRENIKNKENEDKSLKYFQDICQYKEKWCDAFRPLIFTAGAHTTSRAESTNALIKRHLNKTSELSDFIRLIEYLDQEKKSTIKTC